MKALLEKYFEGKTSLEEEAKLLSYFNSGEVEEDLKVYQPLFEHFAEAQQQALPSDFDEKLFKKLEGHEAKVVRMGNWPRQLLRIAAVGALVVAAMVYLWKPTVAHSQQQAAIDWSKYEITDEQQAYDETVKALRLVSNKLHKGTKKAAHEVDKMEKVGKYFN